MKNAKNNLIKNLGLKKIPFSHTAPFLYKIFLATKPNEKGTALGVAFGFGLLMVLLGSLAIIRSGSDKTNAAVNEKAVEVQAVTDIGVSRTIAFLAKNPTYAEYPNNIWTSLGTQTATPEGSYTNTTGSNTSCGSILTTNNVVSNSSVVLSEVTGQQAVNTNDWKKGGYRIQNYEIQDLSNNTINQPTAAAYKIQIDLLKNDPNIPVGTPFAYGILTLRSDVNPNATNLASIFSSTTGGVISANQIQVRIPLIKKDPSFIPLPGLWLDNQTVGSSSNQQVNANVMVKTCTNLNLKIYPNRQVIISQLDMPQLPSFPTYTGTPNATTGATNVTGLYELGNPAFTTYPRAGDVPGANGVYHYLVNSISANGQSKILITPGTKVNFYLRGNLDLGGQAEIKYAGSNCTTLGNNVSPCQRENIRIYGYNNLTNPPSSSPQILLSGNGESAGFIFAPAYSVGLNGGGNSPVNYNGVIWAKQWSGGSNSNALALTQMITDWSALDGLSPQNLPAKVGAVSSLTRQQAN